MDNEEEERQSKNLQEMINHKRKNSQEQDLNHQVTSSTSFPGVASSSTSFSGVASSSTSFSGEEEEEDMLELRLNSHRPSRPRPSVPQPQTQIPVLPELHQLSNTHSRPNLLPTPQPEAQSAPSNHLQLSNTHPLYRGEPLLLAPEPLLYPLNGFYRPNGQSSIAPIQVTAPPPPPPPPPPRSQPPVVLHQDVSPRAVQMPQPQVVFHQDVRPRAMQMPPLRPPPVGPRPLGIRPVRARRNSTQAPGQGKSETVPAPFPWATTKRATVHNLNYLRAHNIVTITGDVQCKRCEKQYEIEYNLEQKFMEVGTYIVENRMRMHDRAPDMWRDPVLPACKYCEQENSARPVLADKKRAINWLFLFLGQMLGCCTLEQLKYFCKHTKNHRTGAKDRVLYLTYLCLCKQLDPTGPFDI